MGWWELGMDVGEMAGSGFGDKQNIEAKNCQKDMQKSVFKILL